MKKIAILALSCALATGFGAGVAMADDLFDQADGNHDGIVSFAEAVGPYPTLNIHLFDQADGNGNGVLDQGEFTELTGLSAGLGR